MNRTVIPDPRELLQAQQVDAALKELLPFTYTIGQFRTGAFRARSGCTLHTHGKNMIRSCQGEQCSQTSQQPILSCRRITWVSSTSIAWAVCIELTSLHCGCIAQIPFHCCAHLLQADVGVLAYQMLSAAGLRMKKLRPTRRLKSRVSDN